MSKKLIIFPEIQKKSPTKRELIAASAYARNPERIKALARKLAFVREIEVRQVEEMTPGRSTRPAFVREGNLSRTCLLVREEVKHDVC